MLLDQHIFKKEAIVGKNIIPPIWGDKTAAPVWGSVVEGKKCKKLDTCQTGVGSTSDKYALSNIFIIKEVLLPFISSFVTFTMSITSTKS